MYGTSALVHNQLWVYHDPAVVGPFSPGEEEHHDERHDGDDTARCRPDPRILDCLGKGIEPCEPRFPSHGEVCSGGALVYRWRDCVELMLVPFEQGEAVNGQSLQRLDRAGMKERREPRESTEWRQWGERSMMLSPASALSLAMSLA